MKGDKVFAVFVLGVLCVGFALAVILVNGGGTAFASVNESVNVLYNFSVNNTQALENISEVNVTLPDGFVFVVSSNDTDVTASTFANTSTILTWTNTPLVTNGTLNFFWFNVTSSATPSDYNFTITSSNSTGVFETQNLSVTVNDTVVPSSIEFVSPSESNNSNITRDNVLVNVTAVDVGTIDTILIRLYNSSGAQINSSNSSTSPVFINFTDLTDGTYTFNATVNDTFGNSNSTGTRTVRLDTVFPTVTINNPAAIAYTVASVPLSVTLNEGGTCVYSIDAGVTNTSMTTTDNLVFTKTLSLADASYTVNYYCNDTAGNLNSSESVAFSVIASATSNAGSGVSTYKPSVSRLEKGYSVNLKRNGKVKFDILGKSHFLKLESIGADSVRISILSDPIILEMGEGDEEKVDVDVDGYYDLSVFLDKIRDGTVSFVLTSIHEKISVDVIPVVGAVVEDVDEVVEDVIPDVEDVVDDEVQVVEDEGINWSLWITVIIIVLIVVVLLGKGIIKKKE